MAKVENEVFQAPSRHPKISIGRNRLYSIALSALLLTGCGSVPKPVVADELTSDRIADLCRIHEDDKGFFNSSLSREEESSLFDMIFALEGPSNFPTHRTAKDMTMDWIQPTLSPDGTKVLYNSLSNATTLVNRDGSNRVSLDIPPEGFKNESAHWFPDGKRVMFSRYDFFNKSRDLFLVGADGSKLTQLTHNGSQVEDWMPNVLANGRVLFLRVDNSVKDEPGTGYYSNEAIFTINSDGSDLKEIKIDNSEDHLFEPHLNRSPDGKRVAFMVQGGVKDHFTPIQGGYAGEGRGPMNLPVMIYDSENGSVRQVSEGIGFWRTTWVGNGEYLRLVRQGGPLLDQKPVIARVSDGITVECPEIQTQIPNKES